jgi:hypothetical protein
MRRSNGASKDENFGFEIKIKIKMKMRRKDEEKKLINFVLDHSKEALIVYRM